MHGIGIDAIGKISANPPLAARLHLVPGSDLPAPSSLPSPLVPSA